MHAKWLLTTAAALTFVASPALAAGDSITNAMKNSINSQHASENAATPSGDQSAEDSASAPEAPSNQSSSGGTSSDVSPDASDHSPDQGVNRSARGDMKSGDRHRDMRHMTERKLRNMLERAGFSHIRVLDAQYLVQAMDNDGNTVFMAMNPPSAARRGETTGFNRHADENERSGMPGGGANDFAEEANGGRYGGAGSQHGWRNDADNVYERGYDEGFREGYARGFSHPYGD